MIPILLIRFGALSLVFGALIWAATLGEGYPTANRFGLAAVGIGIAAIVVAFVLGSIGTVIENRQKARSQE